MMRRIRAFVPWIAAAFAALPWWRRAAQAVQHHGRLLAVAVGLLLAWRIFKGSWLTRLKGSRAWMARLVVYGALGIFLMPWVLPLVARVRQVPVEGGHPLGRTAADAAHAAATPTELPCGLVGLWSSTHAGVMRRIELKEDGRYVMAPSVLGIDPAGGYTGRWRAACSRWPAPPTR